ncbi:hypothetical protein SIID45300_01230 [Candidatus Magnetaquicoccaceae bacterium FCR-1]|uniref:Uncharacterized protein n=1 Tax=Candidatus Magnetaquiglobus chichijimensis TaxID=3141448 RepID=A0ABQ0C893_9PROT
MILSRSEPGVSPRFPTVTVDDGPVQVDVDDCPAQADVDDGPVQVDVDDCPAQADVDDGPVQVDVDDCPAQADVDDGPVQVAGVSPSTMPMMRAT